MRVSKEFMDMVLDVINANRGAVREIRDKIDKLHGKAHDILKEALEEWIERADETLVRTMFEVEEKENIREKAREKLEDFYWGDLELICEKLSRTDSKIAKAYSDFKELEKRAEYLEEIATPVIDTIMPVDSGDLLTIENLVKLIVVVYKICRELEKRGVEP